MRRSRRERDLAHKRRLRYLAENTLAPVYYTDEPWHTRNAKPYYKRYYRGQRSKYLKKLSNRKIRRYDGEVHQKGWGCHKIYDFWWEYE